MPDQPKFQFKAKHGAGLFGLAALILIPFLHVREGDKLQSYWDPMGKVWTACTGVTEGVIPDHTYTQAECDEMDRRAREKFMIQVMTLVPADIDPETLAAYTSLAYNIGIGNFQHSTTRVLANTGDIKGSCEAMMKWVCIHVADGKGDTDGPCKTKFFNQHFIQGLQNRRAAERDLCLKGIK